MQPLLRRFDDHLSRDLRDLAATVRLLDIGEYEVFKAAYRQWFGRAPSEAELSAPFAAYLRRLGLPIWVRHFCRDSLRQANEEEPRGNRRMRRPITGRDPCDEQLYASAITFAAFLLFIFVLA